MVTAENLQWTIYPTFIHTSDKMSHTSKVVGLSPLNTEKVKTFSFWSVSEINSTHKVYIRHF